MAGYRSLLGSWVGGVDAPAPAAIQAGYRSIYGLWLGGIAAPSAAAVQAGYRSFTAMWMGGACAGTAVPDDAYPTGQRLLVEPRLAKRRSILRDDDDMLEIMTLYFQGVDV